MEGKSSNDDNKIEKGCLKLDFQDFASPWRKRGALRCDRLKRKMQKLFAVALGGVPIVISVGLFISFLFFVLRYFLIMLPTRSHIP